MCPHHFMAAYKLEYDLSWTPFEFIATREKEFSLVDKVLNTQLALTDSPYFAGINLSERKAAAEDISMDNKPSV